MSQLVIMIGGLAWMGLLVVTLVLTAGSNKWKINPKHVAYSWELLKLVSLAYFGYLFGTSGG